MLFLIVDFKVLKIVQTTEQAFYWADILAANKDYYVNDLSVGGLKGFTVQELHKIHNNHIKDYKASASWSRDVLVGAVLNIMRDIELDETATYLLNAKLKRKPSEPKIVPLSAAQRLAELGDHTQAGKGVTATQRSTAPANAKRPKPETASGRIWAQCDLILESVGFNSVKNDIMEWGQLEDINPSTVRTQYGHWRRFNNLG